MIRSAIIQGRTAEGKSTEGECGNGEAELTSCAAYDVENAQKMNPIDNSTFRPQAFWIQKAIR